MYILLNINSKLVYANVETKEKIAYRATYIIDPQGIIRWLSVYDLSVGRNVNEVIRVLDALQIDEMTPCGWKKGEATLAE
jgi:peroxiredoxin (alkyl hydroperoxide reductase subunit C)